MKILVILMVVVFVVFVVLPMFAISCVASLTWDNIKKGYIIFFTKESK